MMFRSSLLSITLVVMMMVVLSTSASSQWTVENSQILPENESIHLLSNNVDLSISPVVFRQTHAKSDEFAEVGSLRNIHTGVSSAKTSHPQLPNSSSPGITQTITLQPGWNAIFLEVEPESSEPDVLFADIPVESVWAWNRQSTSMSSVQNPATFGQEQADWLTYIPSDLGTSPLTNLFAIQGGRAYLIKLGGDTAMNWDVAGQPVIRTIDWMADSYNLVGFYTDPNNPPTVKKFFSPVPAHAGEAVYWLNPSGQWENITDSTTESIESGMAYLVYSSGPSNYSGPLSLTFEQDDGLHFGQILTEQTLRIKNESATTKGITLNHQPDADSLSSSEGDLHLDYWSWERKPVPGWVNDFPKQFDIQPGEELALRLAVKRQEMPYISGTIYQSVLAISDGEGVRLLIPVSSESLPRTRAGLWVGTATINKVSFPADSVSPATAVPTTSEFTIRLIIHVDDEGQARLLQQVTLMWQKGTRKPDPQDPSIEVIDEPGRFVLITRDDLVSQFSGAAIRNGEPVGRRISSAAFSFREPIEMDGDFETNLESRPIIVGYDDPLNPFKHKYHPNHDNLDYDFETLQPEGRESYKVVRNIKLEFTDEDPDGLLLPGWGDTQVGGNYEETILGIHKDELIVAGTFRLHHVSRVSVLNDGQE